jgi:hypothetical protein
VPLLHYNGSRWTKVAAGNFGYGTTTDGGSQQVSADGSGGLWLPMPGAGRQQYQARADGRLFSGDDFPVSAR